MDKATADKLYKDLQTTLNTFAKAHGLTLKTGNGRYGSNSLRIPVELFEVTNGKSAEQVEFEKYAKLFGLEPSDYGKTFATGGATYTIVGLAMRSRKYPILAKRQDGQTVKFMTTIKTLLK